MTEITTIEEAIEFIRARRKVVWRDGFATVRSTDDSYQHIIVPRLGRWVCLVCEPDNSHGDCWAARKVGGTS